MEEFVKLDIRGQDRIDFSDDALIHVLIGMARLQIHSKVRDRSVLVNKPLHYKNIEWVGEIIRRQWWLLCLAVPFILIGSWWLVINFGDWGPFGVSLVCFLLFGAWPLVLFLQGRRFLGIASNCHIVVVPMDRKKRKMQRILGLLSQLCPKHVRWELGRSALSQRDTWELSPPNNKPFNYQRYALISLVLGLWGTLNLTHSMHAGFWIGVAVAVTAIASIFRSSNRK